MDDLRERIDRVLQEQFPNAPQMQRDYAAGALLAAFVEVRREPPSQEPPSIEPKCRECGNPPWNHQPWCPVPPPPTDA